MKDESAWTGQDDEPAKLAKLLGEAIALADLTYKHLDFAIENFAITVKAMLERRPGPESERLLSELAYLFMGMLQFSGVRTFIKPAIFLEWCGFSEETVERLATAFTKRMKIDQFAKENGVTSAEDMTILLKLLGYNKDGECKYG